MGLRKVSRAKLIEENEYGYKRCKDVPRRRYKYMLPGEEYTVHIVVIKYMDGAKVAKQGVT